VSENHHHVICLGYDPNQDLNLLVTATKTGPINLWDVRQKMPVNVFLLPLAYTAPITSLCLFKDSLVCGFKDNSLHLWNTRYPSRVKQTIQHSSTVTSVLFDQSRMATGCADSSIYLWNFAIICSQ